MVDPLFVELGSILVLALFFAFSRQRSAYAAIGIGLGAVAGEEICIRAYGAYQYAPHWTVSIDRVPVAVAVIWPAVVLSARAVVKTLAPGRGPFWVGALIAFDAFLIEPIATHAGLWSWNLAGFFGVPLIGPLGWGCYGAAASFLLDRYDGRRALALVALAPLFAHAGILALWWGALRWLQTSIAPLPAIASAFTFCIALAAIVARSSRRLPFREAIPRAAAAGVFAALLIARPAPHLVAYSTAFALPWLAAIGRGSPAGQVLDRPAP